MECAGALVAIYEIESNISLQSFFDCDAVLGPMGRIRAAAILTIDNRFRTPSLELKCLGTSFGGAISIPRDSTWPPCD